MANLQIIPAGKKVEPQYVEMKVPLYSYGCEKKVKKALSHLKGIYSVSVNYKQQKVIVWGICNKQDVLDTIRSKRRKARFWASEDQVELHCHDDEQCVSDDNDEPNKSVISQKLFRSLSWKAWRKGHQVILRKFSLSPSFKFNLAR